jgi:hypothetical protein
LSLALHDDHINWCHVCSKKVSYFMV